MEIKPPNIWHVSTDKQNIYIHPGYDGEKNQYKSKAYTDDLKKHKHKQVWECFLFINQPVNERKRFSAF